jgi:hypothetical protein
VAGRGNSRGAGARSGGGATALWEVEIDGFSAVCVRAASAAQARWKAAKACFDAGYGDRRAGPFDLIRRGITTHPADLFSEIHLPRVGEV